MTDPLDELVERVREAVLAIVGDAVVGILVKGSVHQRDDFIPYWSDADVHVFADPRVMRGPRTPDVEIALGLQERLAAINPDDYEVSVLQVYVIDATHYPDDWTPPHPDRFRIVHGRLPETAWPADDRTYLDSAHDTLRVTTSRIDDLIGRVADAGDAMLARHVRAAGTWLKSAAYAAATVMTGEAHEPWEHPIDVVVGLCEPDVFPSCGFSSFFGRVGEWRTVREDPAELRDMFRTAIAALEEAGAWYGERVGG